MADEKLEGAVMLAATHFLKKPPARMGGLTKNIRFGRTYRTRDVIALFVGAIVGTLFIGAPLGAFFGLWGLMTGLMIGAALALGAVNWTPYKGESLIGSVGLVLLSRRGRVATATGEKKKVYVGLCQLPRVAQGPVKLVPSAVEVQPGWVDPRRLRD